MKSNPLEPCNVVTLLHFLFFFYWKKTMKQDLSSKNKSWLESLKNTFPHSDDVKFSFLFTTFFLLLFDFDGVYTFFVSH